MAIDFEKLERLESQVARLADVRSSRSQRYRERIARSRELRNDAVLNAHPHFAQMALAELLPHGDATLAESGVDVKALRRAALERKLAEEELHAPADEAAAFAALATLAASCRQYAGETQ